VPLALLLVALPPREPRLVAFAALLGVVAYFAPRGPLWTVQWGWALLLGGWFIVAVLVWPGRPFFSRAVGATVAATATSAALIAAFGSWGELDWAISAAHRQAAEAIAMVWPGGVSAEGMELAATVPARLFPSLIAVSSVAGLAVAWWGYSRLARRGRSLGRLVEFRFPDALLWVFIGGLALLVVPLDGWGSRLGYNLVFFMGALYTLRGLAVVMALVLGMVGTQIPVLIALGLVGVLLYPIVVAGTLLLGVTDTWLDLRSGRATNEEG